MRRAFHDRLVEQGLADIAVQSGDARDAGRPEQEAEMEQRPASAVAPDVIQFQLSGVHEYRSGTQKQDQLEKGVVDHVQQRAARGQRVFRAEQVHHGDADQDKADL